MLENAKTKAIWSAGSGPQRVTHWGEHPWSWWRKKVASYRGDVPPRLSIVVRAWDMAGQPTDGASFGADGLREAKSFAKDWVEKTNGSAWVLGRVYLYGEGDFTAENFGEYQTDQPTGFYVWSVDLDFQPITRRGPWANLDEAVGEAKVISRSSQNQHQVVTLGDDPSQAGFAIVKAFRAWSGEVFTLSELPRAGGRLGEYRDNPEYRSGRMRVDYDGFDVRGVLAGAYLGKRGGPMEGQEYQTHLVFIKDDRDVRCGCSQNVDNVVDPYGAQPKGVPPTCERCRKIFDKLDPELQISLVPTHVRNGSGYYVWLLDRSNRPLTTEGPYGPYHTLEGAKPFARISATNGKHDRAISRGRDPRGEDFEIVRKYQARSGVRII